MAATKWKINKRFKELHRDLTAEEYKELEASIKEEGIRDPIIIWRDQIVDGHHRDKIGTKLGIDVPFKMRVFDDELAAEKWILRLQLGRRNLSPADFKLTLGRLYNTEIESSGQQGKSPSGQFVPTADTSGKKAEEIAKKHNVSARTVKRSGKYAKAFDKLPASVKTLLDEKSNRATEACVIAMSTMKAAELNPIAREVRVGNVAKFDAIVKPKAETNGKPKRKKATREVPSTAAIFDQIQRKHFSGSSGLPQSLDKLAEACGSRGPNYKSANDGLNLFLKHGKEMRKGKP